MVLPERRVCEYEIAITACAIRTCTLGWFSSPEIGNPTRRQLQGVLCQEIAEELRIGDWSLESATGGVKGRGFSRAVSAFK
jgi:hypothetical protein